MSLTRVGCWTIGLRQAIPQSQTLIVEMSCNRPRAQMVCWSTRQRSRKRPPPPFLMEQYQEKPTGEPSLSSRADSVIMISKVWRTKPCRVLGPIPIGAERAKTKIPQTPNQSKLLIPGQNLMQDGIRMGGKPVTLTAIVTAILILAGILARIVLLAGTRTRIPKRAGTVTPEEIEISGKGQTVSGRTQIRLRYRYQRRKWRVYRRADK